MTFVEFAYAVILIALIIYAARWLNKHDGRHKLSDDEAEPDVIKVCPECTREYVNQDIRFCLDDGVLLEELKPEEDDEKPIADERV
jgi:hypothetical protein